MNTTAQQVGAQVAEYFDLMSTTDRGAVLAAIERASRKASRRDAQIQQALGVLKSNGAGDVLWKEQP